MTRARLAQWGRPFLLPLGLVALMGAIQLLATVGLAGPVSWWGNVPRTLDALPGILTAHLRHASWGHYLTNAVPLALLSGTAGALLPKATRWGWVLIPAVAGSLLWLFGRPAVHIGASGLVYGWFFFLVAMALLHRSAFALLGLVVALGLFGGLLWVFESGPGVSWEGHVSGAVAGVIASWWVTRPGRGRPRGFFRHASG